MMGKRTFKCACLGSIDELDVSPVTVCSVRDLGTRVRVEKTVEVSMDQAWSLVSDFGHPERVDSDIKTISWSGQGVGAVREISLPEGASATELCVVCDATTFTLVYTILPPAPAVPLTNYVSTIRLAWAGLGRTTVWWTQISESPQMRTSP